MAGILRVTARWSGAIGLPGYSVFHFRDFTAGGEPTQAQADASVAKVRAFFAACASQIPNVVSIQVLGDVPVIEETTNKMSAAFGVATPAVVQGSIGAAVEYAAPVGAVVTWRTGVVKRNRLIRGRTFLVPLGRSAFATNGTLSDAALTQFNTAAAALRDQAGDGDLGVYARPSAVGATDGSWAAVTSHSIPDMGAVMRSRRD